MPFARHSRLVLTLAGLAYAPLPVSGCHGGPVDPPGAGPSPQAAAEPAPFANPPNPSATGTSADSGPAPEPMHSDLGLAPDVLRDVFGRDAGARDTTTRDLRELSGYELQAVLRTGEGPPAPRAPEVNAAVIDAARRKAEARVTIDFAQGRARFVFSGSAFVVPAGTELRARGDRYGHLLLWPGEDSYRVAAPGSLRALLGERRLDVAPVGRADVSSAGEGARRLNLPTRRVEVATRAAKATLEVATVHEADGGGALVCRMLLDLMSAAPSTTACEADEVPLHAELRWTTQGALVFDAIGLARRWDLVAQDLAAPPATLSFTPAPPPQSPAELLVPRSELAAFRTVPVDVAPPSPREAEPGPGLTLVNSTDELRVVSIDGVPAAWLAPGERLGMPTMLRGRYVVQWRTFLGDAWDPPATVAVPGTSEVGRVTTP